VTQTKPITSGVLKALIRAYQFLISPVMAGNCRFHPTCSCYAIEAIDIHGPLAGSWWAIKRIGRCHPWSDAGVDTVPPADANKPLNPLHKC
jgi:putative membrane protein insertion efficiency factor